MSKKKEHSKVNAVDAWACGACGKTYPKTDPGKLQAQKCCTCRECGELTGSYVGTTLGLCGRCCAKKNLESARGHFEQQVKFLEEAENDAKRYGIPIPSRLGKL